MTLFGVSLEPLKIHKVEWKDGKRYVNGEVFGYRFVSSANKPSEEAMRNAAEYLYAKADGREEKYKRKPRGIALRG